MREGARTFSSLYKSLKLLLAFLCRNCLLEADDVGDDDDLVDAGDAKL
jgi:hypothetical protein